MSFTSTAPRVPKGQLKCNLCRKATPPRDGDWCVANGSDSQQVFLCKECEAGAKTTFRKASLPKPERK